METTTVAIIGGSGLYDLDRFVDIEEHEVDTPYGSPSDVVVEGRIEGVRMLFLARHGRGHRLLPSEVNYRAKIFALKKLGAKRLISVSAVGSMVEEIHPGHMVVVDQFIDRTKGRASTFFRDGIVGHVEFAHPVCPDLSGYLFDAASELGIVVHRGGTLMVMEGPQFSTKAESQMHRRFGVDMIGMTAMPEAKLAREAEICYSTLALATDYDCWHESEESVSVDAVMETLKKNSDNAKAVVETVVSKIPPERGCACCGSLDNAIVTDRKLIPNETIGRMKPVFGRVL